MNLLADLTEINPISRTNVNSQLRYAIANRFHVSKISIFHSVNSNFNDGSYGEGDAIEPFSKRLSPISVFTCQNLSGNGFQSSFCRLAVQRDFYITQIQ